VGDTLDLYCDPGATRQPVTITVVASAAQASDPGTAQIIAYFSERALHAAPLALNLAGNMMARHYLGSDARLYAYNHPLPATQGDALDSVLEDGTGFQVALFLIFATGFLMASYALFPVAERINKAKHIQFVSGINGPVYWLGNYIWDFVTLLPAAVGVVIVFALFDVEAYHQNRLGIVFVYFMLFGWAAIPLIYIMQHVFKTTAGAYASLSLLFILGGIAALLAVWITDIIGEGGTSDVLRLVLYIVPNFAFGQALFDMFINQAYGELCGLGNDDACDLYKDNYTSVWEPGVGLQAIYLFFGGVFWFTLLLLGEAGVFPKREPKAFRSPSRDEEADVAAERARVLSSASNDDRLIVKGLTKVYKKKGGSGRFTAVDNLAFGVPAGHCFGLLGVNGAGKTTTFNALTGEIPATKGEIVAAGYNLRNNSSKARRNMGYCPQYDALIGLLTGREHLEIYARLRGVREAEVGTMVSDLIRRLDLGMYADKPSYTYSGGNKRKLSTAIALVAGPKLVLLDEPTTGMDPAARRFLWSVLSDVLANGQSIILTSHSMEECEALCNRLTVMVNGRFRCLGTPGHLKHKYGKGYSLFAKLPVGADGQVPDMQPLKTYLENNLNGAEVREEYAGNVNYRILGETRGYNYMFQILEQARVSFGLEDYGLSETSLEQVFLQFASEQHRDEAEREGVFAASTASSTLVTTL